MTDEVKTNESASESDDDLALKEKFTRWLGEIAAESGPPEPPKTSAKVPQTYSSANLDEWFERKMQEREERAKAKEKEDGLLSRLEKLEQEVTNSKRKKRGVYSIFGG